MEDVVPDPPRNPVPDPDQAEAAYRGFLFADLRGYTSFVERHGDAAAADLLDAYRQLVRDEVARHAGAEIRTEGDSFYVVFRSARRAVACALAIVAAVDEDRQAHPDRPMQVGMGINAGETVQRDEGFVGSAVNLAARVCAQARAGEVLITAAVRDAVGTSSELRFESRGSRRLKGIARPVALFAVRPAGATTYSRGRGLLRGLPARALTVAALAATAVAVAWLSGWGLAGRESSGQGSPSMPAGSASVAATPSNVPSATTDPETFPNAAESELLARWRDDIGDYCDRADADDVPAFRVDAETAAFLGSSTREPLRIDAGVSCNIPRTGAPDEFHFFASRGIFDFRAVDTPGALIRNMAGYLGIAEGDCSSQPVAYQRWELADLGGWLMCREVFGDAVVEWSYDGIPIYGVASRRDGDLATLLDWWREEARLLSR